MRSNVNAVCRRRAGLFKKPQLVSFTRTHKAESRFPLIFVVFQTEANVYSRAVNHDNAGQILYSSRTRRQRKSRTHGLAWKFGSPLL